MTKKFSAKGEELDIDYMNIKSSLQRQPQTEKVEERKKFIRQKENGRRKRVETTEPVITRKKPTKSKTSSKVEEKTNEEETKSD